MVATLDDAKRVSIAVQLAEMRSRQDLLIANDHLLIGAVEDDKIRSTLQEILEQDQKNLSILDTVIVQYGVVGEASQSARHQIATIQDHMNGADLSLADKMLQHELLKHQQVMAGLVVHKAAQVVGADIEGAIAPLHTINFENRAHQEQLKGILEILGVYELTGQTPEQGLWARGEDAIAAATGAIGSVVTRTADDLTIRDVLLMDHSKSDILFAEILGEDDPQKIQEYFGQLYQDVKIHGLAEEHVVYPAVAPYYDPIREIVDQTDDVLEMLETIKHIDPADLQFKPQVEQLRSAVRHHIDQEEAGIFPRLRENFSPKQQQQLATEFKAVKARLQAEQPKGVPSPIQPTARSNDRPHQGATGSINTPALWKRVFQAKAIINWVEAAIFLVADRWIRAFLGTEPLVNVEYSQLVYGLVLIIGIGYWWVSQDLSKNHGIVKLGIIAQFSVFAILAYHTLIGDLHPFYLTSGVLDLLFAILFSLFLGLGTGAREAQSKPV